MNEEWIDVSYTVKAARLNGCKMIKNTATGETKLVSDKVVLDEPVVEEKPKKAKRLIHAANEGDK